MTTLQKSRYRLDADNERLWLGNQPVQITSKAFQLLRYFVGNPQRLLTKDEILEAVWPGVYVTEGLIKEYVHDLRLTLGDDPKQPRFIETVRGRGYRYLGDVDEVSVARAAPQGEPRGGPPSVVVLPFDNMTDDERWRRFANGLCDDLITDLSRYPDLLVIAKSSSFAFQGNHADIRSIGQELGVRYALEGSVQASDTDLRVNIQLIETQQGHHVWAERYQQDIGDLFEIQNDIIGHVASTVGGLEGEIPNAERIRLGRKAPRSLEAYELYLLGYELEEHFQKDSALRAFEILSRSLELDPCFARTWLVFGWTCWQIALEKWKDDPQRYWDLEWEAFAKAAALDPRDPLALMELSSLRATDGDIKGAIDGLERSLDLGRNQADLLILAAKYVATIMDDPERALRMVDRSLELNPRSPHWYCTNVARVAYFARDFDRTVRNARRGSDSLTTRVFELLSHAQLGHTEETEAQARRFNSRFPGFHPEEFMKDPAITAPRARQLFLEGVAKAGLA